MKKLNRQLAQRVWDSPTINTWLSYSTKALSLFIVLPLLVSRFSPAEIALWYLFSTVIAMQGLADMGFKATFIRMVAYGVGGALDIDNFTGKKVASTGKPNWALIGRVVSIMIFIYKRATLLFLLLLVSLGTWALNKPINEIAKTQEAWIAWGVIVIVSCMKFYGTIYSNYLEGSNKVAIVRRWEALTSVGAILTSVVVLIFLKSLLWLVVANQLWLVVNIGRDIVLCRTLDSGMFNKLELGQPFDKKLFDKIWAPAWRSGISGFMSNGLSNISSILYAQIGNSAHVAAYLLALRIINQIRDVSAAPFYSKVPLFSQLRAKNRESELLLKAQRSMFLSNMIFVLGAISFGAFAEPILVLVGSKVEFVDKWLWITLTFAYLVHRYGAMHIQLYSTSNHIVSHIADGVAGVIFIVVAGALVKTLDLYAIPLGMLAGYLGFYAWFAGMHSYRLMNTNFIKFERKASSIPIAILLLYIIANIFIKV